MSVWRTLTRIVKNREKQIALHHEMGRAIARNTMKKDGLDELSIGVTEYWGLRKAYEKCLKEGVDLFQHEGRAFDIGYAYYLLEYLTPRIKQMDHGDWKYSKPIPKPGYTEEVICELPSGNECAEEDLS